MRHRTGTTRIKSDMDGVKDDMAGIKNDMAGIKNDMDGVYRDTSPGPYVYLVSDNLNRYA